jgi:hypothetical protein
MAMIMAAGALIARSEVEGCPDPPALERAEPASRVAATPEVGRDPGPSGGSVLGQVLD